MKIRIKGQELTCNGVQIRGNDTVWDGRESRAVTLPMTYAEALALFADEVPWAVIYEGVDENGTAYANEHDMSDFALAGPITDNRDGTITVKMGKYLPDELLTTTLHAVPESYQSALQLRGIIEEAVQSIEDDAVALQAKNLYPVWAEIPADTMVKAGTRIQHEGDLYKVVADHIPSAERIPGAGTESLYTRIDETHSGTEDDPIPYEGNMALVAELYYTQNGVMYRCTRDTVNPVYHALADLVGLYVEVVA